eukprot:gnl/Hemi2/28205_TR9313_c0_g1_i1.p1 gnl/Hemi2/28205_TR9313_c0_g1~~gnl/Hemi2/28205_TR9313_c0_g1_i1.p1  ORF type:complete len:180 (+),score=41.78 gnl/Hemi2/28205_TR9313_c0_g1_i1:75-614(+)
MQQAEPGRSSPASSSGADDFDADPLYDAEADDRDQVWRQNRRAKLHGNKGAGVSWHTDAILNCPACFAELCCDCQRHSEYKSQYRAMFVKNVTVVKDQVLRYQTNANSSRQKNARAQSQTSQQQDFVREPAPPPGWPGGGPGGGSEMYHPVQCEVCLTEVGVVDMDEVFHFFNVFPSQA